MIARKMKNDRLITVIVGDDEHQEEFKLQEIILRNTSKAFAAALDHEHLGGGTKGILHFPEDDTEAWKVLVFWMIMKRLPEKATENTGKEDRTALLIYCWVLGDKYGLPEFQDVAMLELLFRSRRCWMDAEHVELIADNTMSGSKLRRLAVGEVVLAKMEGTASTPDFTPAYDVPGFAEDVEEGVWSWVQDASVWCSEIGQKDGSGRDGMWKDYMVIEGGPQKHWIHNGYLASLSN